MDKEKVKKQIISIKKYKCMQNLKEDKWIFHVCSFCP